ncbi:UDP-N-acetylmuramoyl-L-alanine--D-glutamate ligase [Alkalibacter saccharofermentans]|uniref:UDP-N-acetylmuramoylalanine--D-glutamate ligase n=1 Tax=Alkalibacter saccharofermentans DSM 14828 TaxID=1120975 RepID=A0A1M4UGY6_9FIRM|nr:UDP-N-acetylmuramoyl-L-alanine--D-glutamate ligase [Alkalibacter saccharofermentans]SHE56021.1 UDP-N-acetylmuramoylalanine--D-glutamate ligase [Alkalibacter saccharofermentans DSM 14828]
MDKKKIIIGLGKSGVSSAKFLLRKGFKIILFDNDPKSALENSDVINILEMPGVEGVYDNRGADELFFDADEAILSPGVPLDNEIVLKALKHGIKLIGEVELAYRYSKGRFLGITGTNGKTTTTTLIYEIFKKSRFNAFLGGNIGNPIVDFIEKPAEKDYIIAELSSFQLETIDRFRSNIAVVLNITPDHMDRHKTMEEYVRAKKNIYRNSQIDDVLVLNKDDEIVKAMSEDSSCRVVYFSITDMLENGAYLHGDWLMAAQNGESVRILERKSLKIPGLHNVKNALAAIAAAFFAGVEPKVISQALNEFKGVEHRLEFVRNLSGIDYYNDSKGTNTDAGIIALNAIDGPVVLIAGGYDKKADFSEWVEVFAGKAKKVFLIGETADQIIGSARKAGYNSVEKCLDLKDAVVKAKEFAKSGDTVLLSPACASWDMFKSYEERGRIFKDLVNKL